VSARIVLSDYAPRAMSDDFRVRVTMRSNAEVGHLAKQLEEGEIGQELARSSPADRVAVSVDDHELFLYADTRGQADAAAAAVRDAATRAGWHAEVSLGRWHPDSEEWEDPDLPLPSSDADRAAEHAEVVSRERAESAAWGVPEYEVRLTCASHRETVELHERLRAEGLQSIRRWHYLLVGARDEDSARALADRLAAEAPAGTTVSVEASFAAVERETPFNPFVLFGGLGG
jgi:hypothetical protein